MHLGGSSSFAFSRREGVGIERAFPLAYLVFLAWLDWLRAWRIFMLLAWVRDGYWRMDSGFGDILAWVRLVYMDGIGWGWADGA